MSTLVGSPTMARTSVPKPSGDRNPGLFRGELAGHGHTLADAFANLERAADVQRLSKHPGRNLLGARFLVRPEEGEGYWDMTKMGEDIYVIVGNFEYKDPRVEFVPGDGLIQFYFNLSGDLTLGISRTEPLRFNRPTLLVYNQPRGVDFDEWTAPSARERVVAITMRPQFLLDSFLLSMLAAPAPLRALIEGEPGKLQYSQLPLTTEMFELANKLVDSRHTGTLGLVYTEAVTLELLCLAIASFNTVAQAPTEEYSERDLRCLHTARNLLMNQFSPAPTIRQVSRAAGMNETSLKRGFKAVFGETIFDFSVRCRMQYALTLLRERRLPVARVAEAVGYVHQTSFATAFRRHFGVRPKDVRPRKSQ